MRKTLELQIAEMLKARPRPWRTAIHPFISLIEGEGRDGIPVSSGWPDFAVFDKHHCLKALVEAKPDDGRWKPRENQLVMLVALASSGFPSFVWSPSETVRIQQDGTPKQVTENSLTDLLLSD
jgi:hypothetical protein